MKLTTKGEFMYCVDEKDDLKINFKFKPLEDRQDVPTDGYSIITPSIARAFLSSHNYERQRAIRKDHILALSNEMKNGRFREKTQINFCRLGNAFYLTNGQHTLSAIVHSGISIKLSIVILDVETMAQVADDFSRHDTHLTRNLGDSLHAHELTDEFGITPSQLRLVAAGAVYYAYLVGQINNQSATKFSNDEKLNIVRRNAQLATEIVRMLDGYKNVSYLTRKTTIAAMMVIYNHQPEMAKSFFIEMIRDDGLLQGDPRKTLLELLKETTTTGGGSFSRAGKKARGDHEFVKLIANAWNAYIQRRQLKLLKCEFTSREAVFDKCQTVRV